MNEIWDSFIGQIAIEEEHVKAAGELSADERLALQEQITRLEKQIQKTQARFVVIDFWWRNRYIVVKCAIIGIFCNY